MFQVDEKTGAVLINPPTDPFENLNNRIKTTVKCFEEYKNSVEPEKELFRRIMANFNKVAGGDLLMLTEDNDGVYTFQGTVKVTPDNMLGVRNISVVNTASVEEMIFKKLQDYGVPVECVDIALSNRDDLLNASLRYSITMKYLKEELE